MKSGSSGSASITLEPVTIAPVTPRAAYFGMAEALMPGAQLLAATPNISPVALSLLSAQILECLLKSFIAINNASEKEVRNRKIHHNLNALWRLAASRGLPISAAPPPWVACLSGLHDDPYYLRYAPGVNALVLPNLRLMSAELIGLFEKVRESI